MKVFKKLFFTLIFVAALGAPAFAQIVGGTISGTVRDATGAFLSGASVVVRQVETGATRTLTTSAEGRFYAPSLPVGHYSITVKGEGFDQQERSGIDLTVGQSLALDFV